MSTRSGWVSNDVLYTSKYVYGISFSGKCWMDALELSLRCTNLLMRSMKKDVDTTHDSQPDLAFDADQQLDEQLNESDCEKHFEDQGRYE
jgi:hypothetical protein